MHTWPAFAKPLAAVAAATFSMSSSGITINGELDPSSMVTFLSPATRQISSPMSRLPVKVMEKMAVGTVVLPRHRRIDWQVLEKTAVKLEKGRIHKASGEESC